MMRDFAERDGNRFLSEKNRFIYSAILVYGFSNTLQRHRYTNKKVFSFK